MSISNPRVFLYWLNRFLGDVCAEQKGKETGSKASCAGEAIGGGQ